MGQFLPGTDFVTSGYTVMPRRDNMFGGGNYDADDLDEWLTLQRDWQVDAGIEPVSEDEVLAVRERAGRAVQAVFAHFGFPAVTDAEIEAATVGLDSRDLPDRDRAADVLAADRCWGGPDVGPRRAGPRRGRLHGRRGGDRRHERQRVSADYLQTSAIIDADGPRALGGQRPNRYSGPAPATGWRASAGSASSALPHVLDPATVGLEDAAIAGPPLVLARRMRGRAPGGRGRARVGPAFGDVLRATLPACATRTCSTAVLEGLRDGGRPGAAGECTRTPTSPSSATTGPGSPGPASASGCSRRGRRSSTAPTCSRSTTSSCSAWRRC